MRVHCERNTGWTDYGIQFEEKDLSALMLPKAAVLVYSVADAPGSFARSNIVALSENAAFLGRVEKMNTYFIDELPWPASLRELFRVHGAVFNAFQPNTLDVLLSAAAIDMIRDTGKFVQFIGSARLRCELDSYQSPTREWPIQRAA